MYRELGGGGEQQPRRDLTVRQGRWPGCLHSEAPHDDHQLEAGSEAEFGQGRLRDCEGCRCGQPEIQRRDLRALAAPQPFRQVPFERIQGTLEVVDPVLQHYDVPALAMVESVGDAQGPVGHLLPEGARIVAGIDAGLGIDPDGGSPQRWEGVMLTEHAPG